jgi:hypothetical protein
MTVFTCDDLRICAVDECDREANASRGWCWTHYQRYRKWGDPLKTYYREACTIAGCDKKHLARGWCVTHYNRWRRTGDPERVDLIYGDDETRLWSKVDASGDCWEWLGGKSSNGYGKFKRKGRTLVAHRVVWETLVGTIPDGLTLDHLCRNRACVNPDHLEPVTVAVNVMRGYGAFAQRARGARRFKEKSHAPV